MSQSIPWVLPGQSQQPTFENANHAIAILEKIDLIEKQYRNLTSDHFPSVSFPVEFRIQLDQRRLI